MLRVRRRKKWEGSVHEGGRFLWNPEKEVRCRNSTATRWSVVMIRSIGKEDPADCVEEGNNTSEIGEPPSSAETQSNGSRAEKQNRSNGLSLEKNPIAG